jgi:Raf kinase inhibitor-like YbhB/YbcL family protein
MDLRRIWGLFFCLSLLAISGGMADNAFTISSPAFQNGQFIPAKHSLHGGNAAPELHFSNVPAHAKSLVVIADDPDSPTGLWTHWLVWNIPASTSSLDGRKLPPGAAQGKNSFGNVHYDGPAPPKGMHRYFFRVYALDATLSVPTGATRATLGAAMTGHVLGHAEFFGTYIEKI